MKDECDVIRVPASDELRCARLTVHFPDPALFWGPVPQMNPRWAAGHGEA